MCERRTRVCVELELRGDWVSGRTAGKAVSGAGASALAPGRPLAAQTPPRFSQCLRSPGSDSPGGGSSKMAQAIFEALEGERVGPGQRLFRVAPPPAAPSQRRAQGAWRPRGGGRRASGPEQPRGGRGREQPGSAGSAGRGPRDRNSAAVQAAGAGGCTRRKQPGAGAWRDRGAGGPARSGTAETFPRPAVPSGLGWSPNKSRAGKEAPPVCTAKSGRDHRPKPVNIGHPPCSGLSSASGVCLGDAGLRSNRIRSCDL